MATELKVYVWDRDVLTDWGDGLVVAIAPSVQDARRQFAVARCKEIGKTLAEETIQRVMKTLDKDPDHVSPVESQVWYLRGSS